MIHCHNRSCYIHYNLVSERPFLEGPEKVSHPENHSKISNLITELFYSRILNMNRGSLHSKSFRRTRFSPCLDTDELKMDLRARKISGSFEKRAPDIKIDHTLSSRLYKRVTYQSCRRSITTRYVRSCSGSKYLFSPFGKEVLVKNNINSV